eukprot:Sspe_Gene.70254::Locus_41477_Transcript_1_1_Confidence_1.000_Length_1859::g.70254::m.70254/K17907/ATG9; autophagy-related protein 9
MAMWGFYRSREGYDEIDSPTVGERQQLVNTSSSSSVPASSFSYQRDAIEMEPIGSNLPSQSPAPTRGGNLGFHYFSHHNISTDRVLEYLYRYCLAKGKSCYLAEQVMGLLQCVFVIALTTFFVLFIDWHSLKSCFQEDCEKVSMITSPNRLNTFQRMCLCFEAIFVVTVLHGIYKLAFKDYPLICTMHEFYSRELGISEADIYFGVVRWPQVVCELVKWQEKGEQHRLTQGEVLSELAIAQRIMRRDNYIIALINSGVITFRLTRATEEVLDCVIFYLYKGEYLDRKRSQSLKHMLYLCGVMSIIGAPVYLMWRLLQSFLRYSLVVKLDPHVLTMRRWSVSAQWTFREFNELPDAFESRMHDSGKAAKEFLDLYPAHVQMVFVKSVLNVAGGLATTLLIISFINESVLIFVTLQRKNLLWWLSMLTVIGMFANSLLRKNQDRVLKRLNPFDGLIEIANYTHWLPDHWRVRQNNEEAVKEFSSDFFPTTPRYYIDEGLAILTTPYHLLVTLPRKTPSIVSFVTSNSQRVAGVGDVIAFSCFDFGRYGRPEYGSPVRGLDWQLNQQGKLEKSLLSFIAVHPSWDVPPDAAEIVKRINVQH